MTFETIIPRNVKISESPSLVARVGLRCHWTGAVAYLNLAK